MLALLLVLLQLTMAVVAQDNGSGACMRSYVVAQYEQEEGSATFSWSPVDPTQFTAQVTYSTTGEAYT
jgi:hypothetical protein